jgi:transposase-like protein
LVEVMGRYSNQDEMASRLGELSVMDPEPTAPIVRKTPKQVQRRLDAEVVDRLVTDYQAGAKVRDLADRYGINRNTVLEHIRRAGVRKHYPALIPEEVDEAARLYRSGKSLVSVSEHFGVNATTVRTALLKAGVKMRDCQGRER